MLNMSEYIYKFKPTACDLGHENLNITVIYTIIGIVRHDKMR